MILLDTNVLSALMRRSPDREVVTWLDGQAPTAVWTTSITLSEIRFRLQLMATGRRRTLLNEAFDLLLERISHRVAVFDAGAAEKAADLMALRHKQGQPGDLRDTMIAGIALAHRAALATRNTQHFADLPVPVINPWIA